MKNYTDTRSPPAESREQYIASIFASLQDSSYLIGPICAIILQIAILSALIVVLRVEIFVNVWASSSSDIHLIYVTLLTVLATLVTAITTGAIRQLWFQRFAFLSDDSGKAVKSRIKVLAGLGSSMDQLRGWQVSLTFVLAGLITTSVVAGLTPRSIVYTTDSFSGQITTQPDAFCVNDISQRSVAGQWFSWTLPNGSTLGLDQDPDSYIRACAPGVARDLVLAGVPDGRPGQVGYIIGDVQVFQDAVGGPWGLDGLNSVFGTVRDSDFLWASRCMPVLQKNPVRCSRAGEAIIDSNGELSVVNGDCKINGNNLQVNPSEDWSAVLGACTGNRSIGTATILLGATNGDPNGSTNGVPNGGENGYADFLSKALDEFVPDGESTYAVTCEVDIMGVVGFQLLNYSRSDNLGARELIGYESEYTVENGYGYQVRAVPNSECTLFDAENNKLSVDDVLSDMALATGAGATWPLLAENMHYDGWFDTLNYIITQVGFHNASQGGGTFKDSTNSMEDALGLTTAITMALYWGGYATGQFTYLDEGKNAYARIRLGPSSLWGILYLIPPLFSCIILIYLVSASWISKRRKVTRGNLGGASFQHVPQEEYGEYASNST